MKALLHSLEQRSSPFLVGLYLSLLLLIAAADVVTGPEISSAIFYALPISLAAWYTGRWAGVATAAVSAILWYVADRTSGSSYSHGVIPIWNTFTRFALFLLLVYLLTAFQGRLREEQKRAITDSLTGLANYRAFYQAAEREFGRCRRYHHPFSIAYIDLDDFKFINDAFGHAAGDVLLRRAAEVMRMSSRETDVIARLGGDEFAILLVETGADAAKQAIGELRLQLLKAMQQAGWPVTFSIGVITFETPPKDVVTMVTAADTLMYTVKRGGKNGFAHAMGDPDVEAAPSPTQPPGPTPS